MRVIIKPAGLIAIGIAFLLATAIVIWDKSQSRLSRAATAPASTTPVTLPAPAAAGLAGANRKGEVVSLGMLHSTDESSEGKVLVGQLINGAAQTKGAQGYSFQITGSEQQFVATEKPVLDTSKSFSVAAWVRLKNTEWFQTFVSQDGAAISAFYLQKRNDSGKFSFTLNSDDRVPPTNPGSDNPIAGYRAQSAEAPQTDTWYHLVGVYDQKAGESRLYVNNKLEQTTRLPAEVKFWQSKGATIIGAALWDGKRADATTGQVEDIHFYPRAINQTEVSRLFQRKP